MTWDRFRKTIKDIETSFLIATVVVLGCISVACFFYGLIVLLQLIPSVLVQILVVVWIVVFTVELIFRFERSK